MRVLVAEDEFLLALEVEQILQSMGHEVLGPVGDVELALELVRRDPPEFALLDVNLGGQLISPVADLLAARGIPFILVTGYGTRSLPENLASAHVLSKPFEARDLARAIAQVAD